MTARTQQRFGDVWAKGPVKSTSNKWILDMTHSQLALYWGDNPDRAARELRSIRDALTFIEQELQKPADGTLLAILGDAS